MPPDYDPIPHAQLLSVITPENPSGENPIADDAWRTLLRDAKGKPEETKITPNPPGSDTPFTKQVFPAEEPAWENIRDAAVSVTRRSHDLVTLGWYTIALLKLHGIPGLVDGLGAIRFALDERWDSLYPALDPLADVPSHRRARELSELAAAMNLKDAYEYRLLRRLRETPIVTAPNFGSYSLASIMMASGKLPTPAGVEAPQMASIEAAWAAADLASLKQTHAALEEAREQLNKITVIFQSKSGNGSSGGLKMGALDAMLVDMQRLVSAAVQRRSGQPVAGGSEPAAEAGVRAPSKASGQPGAIESRADIERALDAVIRFYEDPQQERMASPVTVFVRAARKLLGKSYSDSYTILAHDDLNKIIEKLVNNLSEKPVEK